MNLNYKNFGTGKPLIILHGLMGALDNWQSIAKVLAENFSVYVIDQRNHGKSPHSKELDYDVLANDLKDFLEQQQIESCYIIGHSMGGKAAMHFALMHPEKVKKLIVADIAPVAYNDRHSHIIQAIQSIDLTAVINRDQVQEKLLERIPDLSTVLFLMKGLYRDDTNNFKWRFNIEAIDANYAEISDFPEHKNQFSNETLFLKGSNSNYINSTNYTSIVARFPKNEVTEINNAGHWIHADNAKDFIVAVKEFLLEK